jgi:hypothetical protein|tara:strand:- start:62 stop:451 length:390 start_codon:yes stop_codon:yes gene_type:complete
MESLDRYKKLTQSLISKINNRFSIITFLTIDEIIKDEIDLRSIWWELAEINDTVWAQHKIIQKELENLSEEDYDEWGYEIENEVDDIRNKVDWKVMSAQSLIDGLGKIRDLEEEDEILKRFKDIKPIDI